MHTNQLIKMEIPNFTKRKRKLWTLNLAPGVKARFDHINKFEGKEYREWDPKRSKLAAAIVKKLKQWPIKQEDSILYLGASHGYTPSFLSDICDKGKIYALDFAPRVMRDLVYVCANRKNIIPILGDASKPESYFHKINSQADILYMDVAQREQVKIFLGNIKVFLKKRGFGFLALKAKSIDTTAKPQDIYNKVREELLKQVRIVQEIKLDPLEKDHCMFVVQN